MIFVVNGENRQLFETDLILMHRQRKALFVDELGWRIPVVADLEIDRYDGADTMYLLGKAMPNAELLVSARLLPTVRPHLMSELFPDASSCSFPRGPTVWEVSRFCCASQIQRRVRVQLVLEVVCGVMETGLLFGVEQVVFAVNSALLPLTLRCGWEAEMLSLRTGDNEDKVTAVVAAITPQGLRRVRERFSIAAPVTRYHAHERFHACSDMPDAFSARMSKRPAWSGRRARQPSRQEAGVQTHG